MKKITENIRRHATEGELWFSRLSRTENATATETRATQPNGEDAESGQSHQRQIKVLKGTSDVYG